MSEIIFSYNHTRCHALKVKGLLGGEVYIGEMDGFEIYIRSILKLRNIIISFLAGIIRIMKSNTQIQADHQESKVIDRKSVV